MTVVQLELPDDVVKDISDLAQQLGRPPSAVMQDAIEQYRDGHKRPTGKHRLIDIPPGRGLGEILKPWTSRAELLEDFYDRD
jgi:hypothetical protein